MKPPSSTENIENYLQGLTKEELMSLVLKLAPQTFFDAINAQFASQKEARAIFKKAAKAIDTILSDERLLYEPSKFTEKLLEQLEKLRGLWDKLPSEIGGLLVKLIQSVEQAFEDGYLYIELSLRQKSLKAIQSLWFLNQLSAFEQVLKLRIASP